MTLQWATAIFSFGIIIGIAIGAFVARYPKHADPRRRDLD